MRETDDNMTTAAVLLGALQLGATVINTHWSTALVHSSTGR